MKQLVEGDAIPSAAYFGDFASAYNEEIDQLLGQLAHIGLNELIHESVESFYTQLAHRSESSSILTRLTPEEFNHLKSKQAQHLKLLLTPGLTPQVQYERALQVGWSHEMVALSTPMLLESYHLFHNKIEDILAAVDMAVQDAGKLRNALHQRVQLDMEAQIAIHSRFEEKVASLLVALDEVAQKSGNLADMLRESLQVIGQLDGIAGCLFSRPDARGIMQIEGEGGREGQRYAEALRSRRIPLFEASATREAGRGPAGCAWRSGRIQVNPSFAREAFMHPWHDEATARGFRSSAAVPLLDESGQTFAILSLYSSWPGYFSASTREATLRHIQRVMSHSILNLGQTAVIPGDLRNTYRQYLDDGAVEMLYQPIVDLQTGKVVGLEALARLRGIDGELISPAAFLPAIGNAGLVRLFQLGLEQVCRDMCVWREQDPHLELRISLNMPPDGLTQDVYRDSVFEALGRWGLPASTLTLEMLETKETLNVEKRDARVEEFQRAGIRIAQDDLGSGESSLLRMDRVPCNSVKIDQALVRGSLKRPVRALEFIYYLTQLAQGFGESVTVEGLEDEGLIEAAAILGADHGQGFGIARPMCVRDVMPWIQTWTFPVDPAQPRTALGALAGYLLWDYKLGTFTDWPEFAVQFIKEPWLVQRYLDRSGKHDSDLAMMLERTKILALKGQKSAKYKEMREELIQHLGVIWLAERT